MKDKTKWFSPLADRTTKTSYIPDNILAKALSIASPLIVYMCLGELVTIAGAYIVSTEQFGLLQYAQKHSTEYAMIIRLCAVLVGVMPLIYLFIQEYPVFRPDKNLKIYYLPTVVLLAISSALFFNSVAMLSGFTGTSDTYTQTATAQFSLPIWMGLILYGIITPVTEEIVHRGLIYNRLRNYMGVPFSVIICAFLFGFSHGNFVQLVYGFVMGVLICLIYERLGAFCYPVIFHCFANGAVYVCMSISDMRTAAVSVVGIAVEFIVMMGCIVALFGGKNIDT